MNDDLFLRQFNILVNQLSPILNESRRQVLKEAQSRLSKNQSQQPTTKNEQLNKKMTKEQILNKWLNKY